MIMSRDVHDAVDDARTGNMSSYNALPLKDCTPTSGHQIWQPNVKGGEAVCLAHQSRCKVNWSAESAFDRLQDEVADEYEDDGMSKDRAMKIGGAVAYDAGVKKYGKRVMQEAARKGVSAKSIKSRRRAEAITKNAVGMIIRDGDPSSPPSDIFMAEDKNSYFNKEHDCYQCGKCHTAFDDENAANYCCTACYACGYADHVGFERAQKCCPCNCAETGGGPNGTVKIHFQQKTILNMGLLRYTIKVLSIMKLCCEKPLHQCRMENMAFASQRP